VPRQVQKSQAGGGEEGLDVFGPDELDLAVLHSAVGIRDLYFGAVVASAHHLVPGMSLGFQPVRVGQLECEPAMWSEVTGGSFHQLGPVEDVGRRDDQVEPPV